MYNPTTPENDTASGNNARGKDTSAEKTLYNFTEQGKGKWRIQDDVVMGGRSDSQLSMTEEGQLKFTGRVSLENDGGFCSFQQTTEKDPYVVADKSSFTIMLKGDGKDYNFRVRTPKGRHAYAYTFPTKGDKWETVIIPFDGMKATFHGEPVDVPNYAGENIVEIQILIGNKKEETFELLVESIGVL